MAKRGVQPFRCHRCGEPIQVFLDEETDRVLVGCRYRSCPLEAAGTFREGELRRALLIVSNGCASIAARGGE